MKKLLIIGISLILSACASQSYNSKPSGFLPDYSLLKPVSVPANTSGIKIYTYNNPIFNRNNYNAVILNPVILYQNETSNVSNDQIEAARENIQAGIQKIVSKKAKITSTPGPGVATLSVAISGALQGSDFKPWNLIPISAAIKIASKATGLEQQTPILVVELKFQDSVSGQLLRETLTTISSDNFSNQVSTSEEFQQLAQQWVQEALKYSSERN